MKKIKSILNVIWGIIKDIFNSDAVYLGYIGALLIQLFHYTHRVADVVFGILFLILFIIMVVNITIDQIRKSLKSNQPPT